MAASRTSGARPFAAQLPGEGLSGRVSGLGEGEDSPTLPQGDLSQHMRRGTKAVEAQAGGIPRHLVGAITNEAGAQQRSGLDVRK